MKAEYINPFIQGAESILSMVCAETTTLGKIYGKDSLKEEEVSIAIEIVGQLKGYVYYSMLPSTACAIASKMMMGMPVEQLDDMSTSALCELSNMISGHVATIFSGIGVSVDIRPPQFSKDGVINFSAKYLCVPINLSDNKLFEININITE